MSAIYVNDAHRVNYSNTGSAISAQDVVVIASGTSGKIGIAISDIAASTGTGEVEVFGRFTLPKTTGEAFTQYQALYWDGSALTGTETTTYTYAGRAAAAAASADDTADVIIHE